MSTDPNPATPDENETINPEDGQTAPAADSTTPPKKGVSPIRKIITFVILIALVAAGGIEYLAIYQSRAAFESLDDLMESSEAAVDDSEGDIAEVPTIDRARVEELLGDPSAEPQSDPAGVALIAPYYWNGSFKIYRIRVTYTNNSTAGLRTFEYDNYYRWAGPPEA